MVLVVASKCMILCLIMSVTRVAALIRMKVVMKIQNILQGFIKNTWVLSGVVLVSTEL